MMDVKYAQSKCQQTDAPELELPFFRSPYRVVSSLLSGANQREQQLANIVNRMAVRTNKHQLPLLSPHYPPTPQSGFQSQYYPSQQEPEQNNVFELLEQINQDNIADSHRSQMGQSPLTYANFQNAKYRGFQPAVNVPGPYSVKVESRYKRQVNGDLNPDSQFLNLFDRLAEKIKVVEESEEEEIGNFTCIYRHLHFLNHKNDINLHSLINYYNTFNYPNQWLKDQQVQSFQTCYQMAESMPPQEQEYVEEGKPNLAKINHFFKCLEKDSSKICMQHEIREQIEHNFGPVDDLLEKTKLTEVELYQHVFELIYKDVLDFF